MTRYTPTLCFVMPRLSLSSVLKLSIVVQILAIFVLQATMHKYKMQDYSYVGDDYPRTWNIPHLPLEQVSTPFENSVQFAFDVDLAKDLWESHFPRNGLIQLGKHNRTFSISLFHQLRCISLVREDIVHRRASNYTTEIHPLTGHCLNYLRQMALCRADIDLESVLYKPHPEPHPDVYRCTDWASIYAAMLENHRQHPSQVDELKS